MDVIALAVFSTVIGALVPDSKGDGMRRLIGMIAGFALLLAICRPIAEAAEDIRLIPERLKELLLPEWEEGAVIRQEAEDWIEARGVANVENGVRTLICARYSLDTSDVAVEAETSHDPSGAVTIECLYIKLYCGLDIAPGEIELYIGNLLACPCQVEFFDHPQIRTQESGNGAQAV